MTCSTKRRRTRSLTATAGRFPHIGVLLSLVLATAALTGCADLAVRREAQAAMQRGDVATAIQHYERGVAAYPDSTTLRAGLLQARAEALARTLSTVASARARSDFDAAEKSVAEALSGDPGNERLVALREEILGERRQAQALARASELAGQAQTAQALEVIRLALKDNPRHDGLLSLRRRIEADARAASREVFDTTLAEQRPVSLDFRDASLRTVLDVVSRASGINFVIDKDVRSETRVTVLLRDTPVSDALDLIIATGQLARKVVDARTIVIFPDTAEKRRQYQEQVVRVFQLASADAKGAAALLRSMLGLKEPFVDERSNLIALRDTPENIRIAERLIALYDIGEPEVLLELEVLEVNATRLTELGIKFPDTLSLTPLPPPGETRLTLGNLSAIGRDQIAVGVAGLLLNLRREVGDFTTLANPRVRVRSREQAKILVGDKIPVITTTTGTGGFVSDTINYLDVGLKLDVQPTIYADDDVAIKVSLEVSSLGAAIKTSSGALAYQIGTRNASTLLRLRDGETQLLAGLISREERSSSSRVPGLGDLPVLGRLFSNQLDNGLRKELVLAITPRILQGARRLEASEAELWIGTEARPRLRTAPWLLAPPSQGLSPSTSAAPNAGTANRTNRSPGAAPMASPPAGATPAQPPTVTGPAVSRPNTGDANAVAAQFRLSFEGPASVSVGEDVTLAVRLEATTLMRGLPITLAFDPRHLTPTGVTEGPFFKRDGAATAFTQGVDREAGIVRLGSLRSRATGATGEDVIATVQFKATAAGATQVRLDSATPVHLGPTAPTWPRPKPWSLTIREMPAAANADPAAATAGSR